MHLGYEKKGEVLLARIPQRGRGMFLNFSPATLSPSNPRDWSRCEFGIRGNFQSAKIIAETVWTTRLFREKSSSWILEFSVRNS